MARRRKKDTKGRKAAPITLAPVNLSANIKAELVPVEVENPLWSRDHDGDKTNQRRIGAMVNLNESAITRLAAKGAIDNAQARAAIRFRQLWERMGGAGAGAMDYSRTFVDGGKTPDPISEHQMEAGRTLKAAEQALRKEHGLYAYKLVCYICGEGYSIYDLTETRRQRDTMTDLLRMYLDVLAGLWGMAKRERKRV
jgi:hypothetical protein